MTGGLWALATIVGPILLGLVIYFGLRQSAQFGADRTAVERQQRAVRESYGGDARDQRPPTMPAAPFTGRRPAMIAGGIALALALTSALTWTLTRDASDRRMLPQVANNEAGTRKIAPSEPAPPQARTSNEATCRTTPAREQAGGAHEACAFIAAQIPKLQQDTSDLARPAIPGSSRGLKPGDDMPADVRELKPLPEQVSAKYPALQGAQYFLDGQNIVVVGEQAKVQFVIDVRIRP